MSNDLPATGHEQFPLEGPRSTIDVPRARRIVCGTARDAGDARDLLEMLGLVEPLTPLPPDLVASNSELDWLFSHGWEMQP